MPESPPRIKTSFRNEMRCCDSESDPVGRLLLLFDVQDRGEYTQTEIAELFNVSRATVYRELRRRRVALLATCEAHIF